MRVSDLVTDVEKPPSESDEWSTPKALFDALRARHDFTLDAAAAAWNAKCAAYLDQRANALRRPWRGRVWLNPPYGRGQLARWMAKARQEVLARRAELVGCLVPAYTCESWWQDNVEAPAGRLLRADHRLDELGATTVLEWEELTVEWTRLRGRVRFREQNGKTGSAPFSSAFVLFRAP